MFNLFLQDIKKLTKSESKKFPNLRHSRHDVSKQSDLLICKLIENNKIPKQSVLDLCCGHGNRLKAINEQFNSKCVGIDINKSKNWLEYKSETIHFFKHDVDNVIKNINCKKPFDIILTMNTLRGHFEDDNYKNEFLNWCSKNCKYLITNSCNNKNFKGFNLVDNISAKEDLKIEDIKIYDCNLFKSKINGGVDK